MPLRAIPGSEDQYALVAFDEEGRERTEAAGTPLSEHLLAGVTVPTDIFLDLHGWKGDVPAAIEQYDRWFAAMAKLPGSRELVAQKRPDGFRPMWIGLHWPSLPWGDEELPASISFAAGAAEAMIEAYVERLGDRPGLREAIATIIRHAQLDTAPPIMPPPVVAAYEAIDSLMTELPADGPGAAPGEDNPPFDAAAIYQAAQADAVAFGGLGLGGLLTPLRQLSFWKMKARARSIGEGGFHSFCAQLIARYPDARLHLMGHSFGCIAASAAIAGGPGARVNKVASLVLVQGALSLWAYAGRLPFGRERRGYFAKALAEEAVRGAIVTTRSRFDRAVGALYPLGARAAGQVEFGVELPRYGALGTFGAQGVADARDLPIAPAGAPYYFTSGRVYNVEASAAIFRGGGLSGAHSDIDGPEVAHLVWSAAAS